MRILAPSAVGRRSPSWPTVALVLASIAAPRPARADELRANVEKVCQSIAKILQGEQQQQIAIGRFTGPPAFDSSGPGIVQLFKECFSALDVDVHPRAKIGLKGEYAVQSAAGFDADDNGRPAEFVSIRLTGQLVDSSSGQILTSFSQEGLHEGAFELRVDREEEVVQLLGVSVDLPPRDTQAQRSARIVDAMEHAEDYFVASGSRVSASADSPYAVEICVNGAPRPAAMQPDYDMPFVPLSDGETYTVRLYNDSPYDAAVTLQIDGISSFEFSAVRHESGELKGRPKYRYYIVAPGSVVEVHGWHKSLQAVSGFKITPYAESAAGAMGHQQDVGTVTALFAAAWTDAAPPDERVTKGGPRATGFGADVAQGTREVRREVGRLRASISLRYERER